MRSSGSNKNNHICDITVESDQPPRYFFSFSLSIATAESTATDDDDADNDVGDENTSLRDDVVLHGWILI